MAGHAMGESGSGSGLRMVTLRSLQADAAGCMLVAVIIAKSSPRVFKKAAGSETGMGSIAEPRGVFSFTIRDSTIDTANCSAWGSPQFVMSLDQMFHVGDVSSPFRIVLNERQSEITIHEAENYTDYLPLLHLPTKSAAGYFTLADVEKSSQDFREDTIDLLVAVRAVAPPRNIKTKLGDEIQHREVSVMDQTTTNPFKIMIWEAEAIKRASSWQPRETVLFVSDIKLEWNNFNKAVVGRIIGRTVITEDPHTAEAEALRVFARHAPILRSAVLDRVSREIPDPISIRSVMTVQQVLDRANGEEHVQFTALMYTVITQMDLDGTGKVTVTKCGNCSSMIKESKTICDNIECSVSSGAENIEPEIHFNVYVTLTDHTGSLRNCRLTGKFAESVLGCSVAEFLSMDVDMRGQLKWRFLLERCTVRIVVMKGPLVSILACSIGDPNEVVSKLPVY